MVNEFKNMVRKAGKSIDLGQSRPGFGISAKNNVECTCYQPPALFLIENLVLVLFLWYYKGTTYQVPRLSVILVCDVRIWVSLKTRNRHMADDGLFSLQALLQLPARHRVPADDVTDAQTK